MLSPQGLELLRAGAEELGVSLSEEALKGFSIYYGELLRWGRRMNLTAIRKEREVVIKHFLDSLTIPPILPKGGRVADLGSGAGLPGIPIKLALPEADITLIERSKRKSLFLRHLARTLGLKEGLEIITADAREIKGVQFAVVVSRAVASLKQLCKLAGPLLAPGGLIIAMRGPAEVLSEVIHPRPQNSKLKVERVISLTLPFSDYKRRLVLLRP